MRLKMTQEHQDYIKSGIERFNTTFYRDRYASAGLSDKRYRWDLIRAAGLMPWLCDVLYTYLNDDHIDNALKHLVAPLHQN